MSTGSQFITPNYPSYTAGAAITQNNLVYLNQGMVFPVNTSDGAVAYSSIPSSGYQNAAAPYNAGSATFLYNGILTPGYSSRYYANGFTGLLGSDGYVYYISSSVMGDSSRPCLHRMTTDGKIVATLNFTQTMSHIPSQIISLTNGNLVCSFNNGIAYVVNISTFTVASNTVTSNQFMPICALSGGGFFGLYATNSTTINGKFFDNTGTVTATCNSNTCDSGYSPYGCCAQLSNGNIAIAYANNSGLLYYSSYTTAGGAAVYTYGTSYAYQVTNQYICVVNNNFYLSVYDGASQYGYVTETNATGSQSGPAWCTANYIMGGYGKSWATDGNNQTFFFLILNGVISAFRVGYSTYILSTQFPSSGYTALVCSTPDNLGNVLIWTTNSNTYQGYAVFNIYLETFIIQPSYVPTQLPPYQQNNSPTIITCGDGYFMVFAGSTANSATGLWTIKVGQTPILGVAQSSVAAGSSVAVDVSGGTKTIVPVKGNQGKAFNHQGIGGNSGTILGSTVILNGLGAKSGRNIS